MDHFASFSFRGLSNRSSAHLLLCEGLDDEINVLKSNFKYEYMQAHQNSFHTVVFSLRP